MTFDAQGIFANLAEKERVHGHHSVEGWAIRTLSRALNGWSAGNLAADDVIVLCDQAIEDWLKARLRVSAWAATSLRRLLAAAVATELITQVELIHLQTVHDLRAQSTPDAISVDDVEAALKWTVEIVERHWS